MHWPQSRRLSAFASVLLLAQTVASQEVVFNLSSVSREPVLQEDGSWGAPCLIKVEGDGFYSFATNNRWANIPVAYSPDFENWELLKDSNGDALDAMPYIPSWVNPNLPGLWGPDVSVLDNGTYVMYFAGGLPSGQHCLGAAYSDNIRGPYIPQNETWFCPDEPDRVIDPDGFKDVATGKRYVSFKWNQRSKNPHPGQVERDVSYCGSQGPPWAPTPITLQEVGPDGWTKIGSSIPIMDNDGPADLGNAESPSLMRTDDGVYVLFFSTGCYLDGSYTVSYAVSTKSVLGPYTRNPTPLFRSNDKWNMMGPGVADVLPDGLYMTLFAQVLGETNPEQERKLRTALIDVVGTVVMPNGTLPNGKLSSVPTLSLDISTPPSPTPSDEPSAAAGHPKAGLWVGIFAAVFVSITSLAL